MRLGRGWAIMILFAAAEETYCLKTQRHLPMDNGTNTVCYRCGMLLGPSQSETLGTLMDY